MENRIVLRIYNTKMGGEGILKNGGAGLQQTKEGIKIYENFDNKNKAILQLND